LHTKFTGTHNDQELWRKEELKRQLGSEEAMKVKKIRLEVWNAHRDPKEKKTSKA
jgi:hypothetical protein